MKVSLLPLLILGCIIATTSPSRLSQQIVLMENLMTTTAGNVGSSIADDDTAPASNPLIKSWSTTEEKPINEDEDYPVDEEATTELSTYNIENEDGNEETNAEGSGAEDSAASDTADESQCALCFFGLPRSYKEMVLPSIVKNVVEPNAKHHCDIFVHFYARKKELKGRLNAGGEMDPNDIFELESAVQKVAKATASSPPAVIFTNDTERTFFDLRSKQLDKYLKTRDKETGKKVYFPWKQTTWKRSSLVNLVRQWHSIDNVFRSMEKYMITMEKNYTRVAMLRNDAMYLSPIDIFQLDGDLSNTESQTDASNVDISNQHFVIAPFANYPVNDRMVYGPFEAIKIWATRRFDLIERRAKNPKTRGMVMHSETFMKQSIFHAMENLGYKRHVHPGLCFIRTRAASMALLNDCRMKGTARGFENKTDTVSKIETILKRSCEPTSGQDGNPAYHLIQC